jgi:hypothetical protein
MLNSDFFPREILQREPQVLFMQLILRSETKCYAKGSIIADSRDDAKQIMVISSGQVNNVQICRHLRWLSGGICGAVTDSN